MSTKPTETSPLIQTSSYQLPYELEREICETSAYNLPKCIPKLILVAHRFRIWIEPELYRIILSGDDMSRLPLYVPPPQLPHPPSRVLDKARIKGFGHHVQHVLLWSKSPEEVAEILECCPNVSNLGLWLIKPGAWGPLRSILETLPLRKLSIDPSDLFSDYSIDDGIPFNGPIFLNLTHLEIINSTSSWSKWKQLALLPKLTHLALYLADIDQEFIDRVLEECRVLESLIMLYYFMDTIRNLELPQKDERVVCLRAIEDILGECREWEKGARGKEDCCIKGQIMKEETIRARKRNAAPNVIDNIGQAQ